MAWTRMRGESDIEDIVLVDIFRGLKAIFTQNDKLEDGTFERHLSVSAIGRKPTREEMNQVLSIVGAKGNITAAIKFTAPVKAPDGIRDGFHIYWK